MTCPTIKIQQLVAEYANAIDGLDIKRVCSLFLPDGVLQSPDWKCFGREQISSRLNKLVARSSKPDIFIRHHVNTHLVKLHSESKATGAAYFTAITQRGLDHSGTYLDKYELYEEQWLFAERKIILDWSARNEK